MNIPSRRWTLVPVAAFILVWSMVAQTRWAGAHAIPSPREVLITGRQELAAASLWLDLAATLARVTAGTVIAVASGTVLAVALSTTSRVWRASEPTVEFVRSIPPILTYPLCLLAFGYGEGARLAAVVFGTTGIVLIHVARGLAQTPAARTEIVHMSGLRGFAAVRCLYAYEMLPALFIATRLALAGALIISIVTEMLVGAGYGLGCRAQTALLEYRADVLWLVILLAGAAGTAMSALVSATERRLVDWRDC